MEEKGIIVGDLENTELLEKVATFYDNRFAIIDNVHNIGENTVAKVEVFAVTLCLKGRGALYIDDREYTIHANDILICLPNVILEHGMMSVDFDCCGFILSPEYMTHIGMLIGHNWNMKMFLEKYPVFSLNEEEVKTFLQYFELLRSRLTGMPCKYHKELMEALLQAFMYDFGSALERFVEPANLSYTSGDNLFRSFLDQLSSSYPKKRSVAYYADRLHVTAKYLSAVCKDVSGKTASDWINRYVMKDVEYQLKRTRKSIKEIANELDFPSLSFFGKYVKRYLGVSPREYRDKLLNEVI